MTMKSSLSGPFLLLLLLLGSAVSALGSVVLRHYHHINAYYTWQQAQSYCRRSTTYNDLATIFTQSDADSMNMQQYNAWIGLYKDTTSILSSWANGWIWTNGDYYNLSLWATNEPYWNDECAYVHYTTKRIYGTGCSGLAFFFCHKLTKSNFDYTFIPQSKTWSEAQQYCMENYDDLAAFEEESKLNSAVNQEDFPVWTGLYRNGDVWKWSMGLSEYTQWESGEPGKEGDCVSISSLKKKMSTQDCSARFPFVCMSDNLVLVRENKTWEEALKHCRALKSPHNQYIRHELISVQPGEDHSYVINKVIEANTEEVWTGLRFLAGQWLFVNSAAMLYPDLPLCPPSRQHCGALSKNDMGSMEIRDCSEKRNFLCYRI